MLACCKTFLAKYNQKKRSMLHREVEMALTKWDNADDQGKLFLWHCVFWVYDQSVPAEMRGRISAIVIKDKSFAIHLKKHKI